MITSRVTWLVLAFVALVSGPVHAGFLYLPDIHAYIQAGGQTVIGTASTYEAVLLFKSTDGSGMVLEEIQPFGEDKFFEVSPTGGVFGYNHPVNGGNILFGAVANIALDVWHHAAYVYDGAEERVYFDGMLVGSRAGSGDVADADSPMYIGASVEHQYTTFIGLLDSVRVSGVARYVGASFTPPTGDLANDTDTLLLYNFNDPAGSTTVADSSGNNRTGIFGSLNGGPVPVPCGADTGDLDGDLVPDSCDPDTPTTTTTTTTTTLPSVELCGNCIDDDGNGKTDFEDDACCAPGQPPTLTLKKGTIKPAGNGAKLTLAATLSAAGLTPGASQDVFLQLASASGEVLCAHVAGTALVRKKNGIVFKDPGHAVGSALGVDRLLVSQKKTGAGRLKAGGKQVTLVPPAAGPLGVVLGLRDPITAEAANVCARGGGTFHATKKGVLKFP